MANYSFSKSSVVNINTVVLAMLMIWTRASMARPDLEYSSLPARLKVEEGSSECWESLFELQSCTAEVIIFFLNGETHLGANCCRAIHVIQVKCWPALLTSLGFTPQEDDILRGYCDVTADLLHH